MIDAPIRDACSHCYMGDACDGTCKSEPYPIRWIGLVLVIASIWVIVAALILLLIEAL